MVFCDAKFQVRYCLPGRTKKCHFKCSFKCIKKKLRMDLRSTKGRGLQRISTVEWPFEI